ncbi:MAG: DEAD/DEAH box helicase [Longimicrobiales bacterium]|nr:DEAD/DEAH box helicase [Longimicrobiales bacterium]
MSFSALGLHADLLKAVDALGFTEPTPIQAQAIPPALQGRDLLGCAATGSGKTAAFLLPILQDLIGRPRGSTRALILAPTRELAMQICADVGDLARFTGIRATAVYGGVNINPQTRALSRGVDIVVATPGRLLDHFGQGNAPLASLEYLVLDEADRMLDMGFLPDIRRILRHIPRPRQTLFFSATMPPEIEKLTHEILTDPVRLALQVKAAPASGVRQSLYPVPQNLKAALLTTLIQQNQVYQALVFTRTKHRADRLTKQLNRAEVTAERIHGNRSQAQRTRALDGFRAGRFQVLVATDIAARGIDVESLGHVVNFDVPNLSEDYIHRVGRTARARNTGEAWTLFAPDEEPHIRTIERAVQAPLPRITVDGFNYAGTGEAVEVPLQDRLAALRARRREERERSAAREGRGEAAQGRAGGSQRAGRSASGSRKR